MGNGHTDQDLQSSSGTYAWRLLKSFSNIPIGEDGNPPTSGGVLSVFPICIDHSESHLSKMEGAHQEGCSNADVLGGAMLACHRLCGLQKSRGCKSLSIMETRRDSLNQLLCKCCHTFR